MKRIDLIERVRRIANGGEFPSDDFPLSVGLVNSLINDAIGAAIKANWLENIKIDNIGSVNSSFYSTFSKLPLAPDDEFGIYNITLPSLPTALGKSEGVASVYVVDTNGTVAKGVIMLTISQSQYFEDMPAVNGIFGWSEGKVFKIKCTETPLDGYTAKVRMVSTGTSTDLDSEINVPAEFNSLMMKYLLETLGYAAQAKVDNSNDGIAQP